MTLKKNNSTPGAQYESLVAYLTERSGVKLAGTRTVLISFEPRHKSDPLRDRALYYERMAMTPARGLRKLRRLADRARQTGGVNFYTIAKRAFDLTFGSLVLLLSSPVLFMIAIAIKITDGGPVLFWQKRVGQFGELCSIFPSSDP